MQISFYQQVHSAVMSNGKEKLAGSYTILILSEPKWSRICSQTVPVERGNLPRSYLEDVVVAKVGLDAVPEAQPPRRGGAATQDGGRGTGGRPRKRARLRLHLHGRIVPITNLHRALESPHTAQKEQSAYMSMSKNRTFSTETRLAGDEKKKLPLIWLGAGGAVRPDGQRVGVSA